MQKDLPRWASLPEEQLLAAASTSRLTNEDKIYLRVTRLFAPGPHLLRNAFIAPRLFALRLFF